MASAQHEAPVSHTSRPNSRRRLWIGLGVGLVLLCGLWAWGLSSVGSFLQAFYKDPGIAVRNDPDSKAYYQAAQPWMDSYASAITQFNTLEQHRQVQDPQWRQAVHQQLDAIATVDGAIEAYQPPYLYQSWHMGLRSDVANPYDRFAKLYGEGIDQQDSGKISEALVVLQSADPKRRRFAATLGMIR